MDFKLNCSPHRDLIDIIPRLFNVKKLSDVQFIVEDRTIWAHSLVLMGRSEVFEEQMEATYGEKKLIPVDGYKYESFLEFMRYIYTDVCKINDDNGLDLLKLAVKYRIIKLENQVINSLWLSKWDLKLFNYVVIDNYEIARNHVYEIIPANYTGYLQQTHLTQLHPDAMNEFLKFNKIEKNVTEMKIFNAMAMWINSYCESHHMSLSEGRQKFDKLIRNIRFATMPQDKLNQCVKNFPGLLNDSDLNSITKQILFGGEDDLWISKCREEYMGLYHWIEFTSETVFKTTFTVLKPTVLYGLRIGIDEQRKPIEINISNENGSESLTFTQSSPRKLWNRLVISLGNSIILKPRMRYAIQIKCLEVVEPTIHVRCRKRDTDIIINDPNNSVQLTEWSANMLEMFFKPPLE